MISSNEAARKKYLAKIQKLMRLASNTSSPHEAASAMAKAQAFMREHGLSESEVTFAEISTSASKSAPSDAVKMPYYMIILASTVEKAFGVRSIYGWRWTSSRKPKRVVSFYGHDGRDIAAAYVFDVLTRQLRAARKEFQRDHCWRYRQSKIVALADKFCEGWVSGAWHAVQAMAVSEEQQEQMAAYTDRMKADGVKEAKAREAKECSGNQKAAWLGYQEGKNTKLYHGVDGQQTEPARLALQARNSE
ncbi:DUF2786 domain-containing protein [Winslowiella arboricola]|uniref:DUF2786 domain-containing protein n=1 Tax=Winslowiella arboricola TaxID=2978220 RepID=UPI00225E5079|nr:DUF2786 domain-containing protein [Winslowiella arboricola]MCU5775192.1 DUF2786 domain-containing protein [Winslowiella arboricola]